MQATISVNNTITTQLSPQCSIENNISILFLSNVHSLCIGGMIFFTDAAIVEMVTPLISRSWIGQTVKLTCKADGAPTPTLTWKNPSGKVIKQETELKTTVCASMISDQDFGNYTCEASNDVSTDRRIVLVQHISKWNIYNNIVLYLCINTVKPLLSGPPI